jgi:hypothetical protein
MERRSGSAKNAISETCAAAGGAATTHTTVRSGKVGITGTPLEPRTLSGRGAWTVGALRSRRRRRRASVPNAARRSDDAWCDTVIRSRWRGTVPIAGSRMSVGFSATRLGHRTPAHGSRSRRYGSSMPSVTRPRRPSRSEYGRVLEPDRLTGCRISSSRRRRRLVLGEDLPQLRLLLARQVG